MTGVRLRIRAYWQRRMAAWVRRRQGLDQLPVTLQRRRLYILPTRAGMAFAALVLLMLIAALNYANSLALLVTFLLASLALVSMHACHRNLLGLTVADLAVGDSFAGDAASVRVRLANTSAQARIGIELDAGVSGDLHQYHAPANGEVVAELHLPTPRRGLCPLGRVRLQTSYPFGLFRAWTWLHVHAAATVYPRPHGQRAVPSSAGLQMGSAPRDSGEMDEWAGLRPFRDGDSPRQVAWKAYAGGAPLLVKEYTASGAAERIFDFEKLAGLDTEQRLSQLSAWIVAAARASEAFGLELPRQHMEVDQGPLHRQRCLRALALYDVHV